MNEKRHPHDPLDPSLEPAPEDGEIIGRLLRMAGPRAEAPPELAQRVKAAVHAQWRQEVSARRRRKTMVWSAGALAAAALALVVALVERPTVEPPPAVDQPAAILVLGAGVLRAPAGVTVREGSDIPPGAVLETAGENRLALRLSNGATVRLDTQTRVRLEGSSVLQLDRGRIYLVSEGAPDERDALEVRTGFGAVRDVGTRFEVRVQERELRVRVRQGIVNVDRPERKQEIFTGTELTIDDAGNTRMEAIPPNDPSWNWVLDVAPAFELEGRTLGQFLEWVSAETGLRVVYSPMLDEEPTSRIVLHGSIGALRPDQAPEAVLPTCGLGHRVTGDSLVVIPSTTPIPATPPAQR